MTDRLVVVGTDSVPVGHLYALDRASGAVRWKHAFPGGVGAQVLRRGGTAFAVSAAGEIVAVELESGRIVWRTLPTEDAGDRQFDPLLDGDRLFVGWRSGAVEALDLATGQRIWRTPLGERLNTSLAAAGAAQGVGTQTGGLHRLSREDGRVLARLAVQGMPYGDLVAAGGCLLSLQAAAKDPASPEGAFTLACLDPALSRTLWSFRSEKELSTFRPLIHAGRAVIGWDGTLTSLDLGTGARAWSCPVQGVPRGVGAAGGSLYVGTLSGRVLALDPARCAVAASLR